MSVVENAGTHAAYESCATLLQAYTIAVRTYGMTEVMAEAADDRRDWARELRKWALKARDAAQALADFDPTSAMGLGWLDEATRWEHLAPRPGVRRGDSS